ncbi:MAG TPA: LysR family transcriptional regulator [Actinopolymorphaceae bacterium]|jgi:DNA-binding transcriptional LysR family regulator
MLNLERLRALHAVAMYGSVSAAADALHVTAPAISQQIAKLEREVGQRLVERNGRGVRLTDAAHRLVVHAAEILSLVERAEADLEAHRDRPVGRLVVAAFPTAARGLGPAVLQSLRTEHPQLEVELREIDPDGSLPLLARGEVDITITLDWDGGPLPVPDNTLRQPILTDPCDVALPATHPLAGRKSVRLAELASEPWVSWPHGSLCFGWLAQTLRSLGSEPRIVHTANEHATQLALVSAGLGIALMPRLGRSPIPRNVRIVPLQPALRRHVYALWRADADRRPAIRAAVSAFVRAAS